jgi:creatinine amidohydrolase
MLHLFPELVRLHSAAIGNTTPLDQLMPIMRQQGVRAVSQTGILGDPTTASAEQGLVLVEQNVSSLVSRLEHCHSTWKSSE